MAPSPGVTDNAVNRVYIMKYLASYWHSAEEYTGDTKERPVEIDFSAGLFRWGSPR